MGKVGTIVIVVVAVLGAGWYFFMADESGKREARKAVYDVKHQAKKAAGAMSVDTAKLHDPRAAAQCRENIKRIESAKRRVAQERGIAVGEVPFDAVVQQMGGALPKCPSGGNYQINPLGTMVRCTIGANGTKDPNDDHLITNW